MIFVFYWKCKNNCKAFKLPKMLLSDIFTKTDISLTVGMSFFCLGTHILVLTGLDLTLAFFLAVQYGIIKIRVRTENSYWYANPASTAYP